MNTDEIKQYAVGAVRHWFNLVIEDMKDMLPVGLTLKKWKKAKPAQSFDVYLEFSALPGFNFEIWAHKHWKWDGHFSVFVSWLPPGEDEPPKSGLLNSSTRWTNEYEVAKKPNERPFVLDCREGQLWMQASE